MPAANKLEHYRVIQILCYCYHVIKHTSKKALLIMINTHNKHPKDSEHSANRNCG